MDRPRAPNRHRLRRVGLIAAAILASGLLTLGLYGISSPPPVVERRGVWIDTVRRGPVVFAVRGPGTLVPEQVRWVVAETEGRVESRLLDAGAQVAPDTVLVELSNPELELRARQAELELRAADSEMQSLRVVLEHDLLDDEAAAARVEADWRQAQLEVESNEELARDGLVPAIALKISRVRAEELTVLKDLERRRLDSAGRTNEARLAAQGARVDQLRAIAELRRRQVEALRVPAGVAGVLQEIPVEPGQAVTAGTPLARVAQPETLEARLLVPQGQASEIQLGQEASIDTRNGIVPGHVTRIDPVVRNGSVIVEVALDGALPRGARPDLTVDGTITIARLDDVLHVGRPAFAPSGQAVGLFRLIPGTERAERVQVVLGRASVQVVEVSSGLSEGDQVILSDVPGLEEEQTIRLE